MRPRGALWLVAAFEAGLATGLSHFLAPLFAAAGMLALLALLRSRPEWVYPGAAILGLALGVASRVADRASCAALMPPGPVRALLEIQEPVAEGIAAGRPLGVGCRGAITVRVRSRSLIPAGTRWLARGRWIPSPRFGGRSDGILVVAELSPRPGSPGLSDRLRTWLSRTTARLYGARAGLVDALLVGRRGGIDPEINAEFARSGLVHLLSISGFHVGVVLAWTLLLLRGLKLSRGRATAVALVMVFCYVGFLGWPAPAARAALLAAISAGSFARQRQPAAGHLFALTCLTVTVLDPWALFDLGGWLSGAAFLGSMTFTRWSDRAVGTAAGWRMLFASLGATLATAPLTALALGSVALAGLVLNFAAIPLAAVAVPGVLASVLLAPIAAGPAAALAAGGGLGLAGLEALARLGARIPLGAVTALPGIVAALPWMVVLAAACWVLGRRNTSRRAALRAGWLLGLAGVLTLAPALPGSSADDGSGLSLHFLSVGQGDAALIRTPHGRWIMVDAGPADGRRDAGREVLVPFLTRHGVRSLALFVLSHAHLDHLGGAGAVLGRIPAEQILEPAEPVPEPAYRALLDLAMARGYPWRPARAGDSLAVDGVTLRVLHPDTTWARWRDDLNDDSVVLLLRWGAFEALLGGDLGVRAESLLAGRVGRVDLLKVGHHGSAGSSGKAWLAELRPRAAVVSVGPNTYGHPSPAALQRLGAAGADVWRTDREGTVTVLVTDSTMTLRGRRLVRRYALRP